MRAATSSLVLTAGLLLASTPALAGARDGRAPETRDLLTPLGEYLLLGGGVTDFAKDATRDRFDTGGAWDARVGVGSRYFLGAEVAYVGGAANAVGAGPDLRMDGVEGVVRAQVPYLTPSGWLVEPFAFGGIGVTRLSLRDAPPGVKDSDDVGVVPFGAGVTIGYRRFLLDARFTYRTAFDEDLTLAAGQPALNVERWAAGASIGYEF